MDALGKYTFCGHGVIMGKHARSWQNINRVLAMFGKQTGAARRSYRAFVSKGIEQGKRPDLTGGGLIRSAGGWAAVKALKKSGIHAKSDECILGDGVFVDDILSRSREDLAPQSDLAAKGMNVDDIAERVSGLLGMQPEQVWLPGKYKQLVTARSLLCFWAVRGLRESMTSMARRLNISTAAVSKAVTRGAKIAEEEGYALD